jgi:hypothetical protein
LEAVDPVVNDHFGRCVLAVRRKREAQFQWRRARHSLIFARWITEAEPDRIRRKLEVGLDEVLKEEGADPSRLPRMIEGSPLQNKFDTTCHGPRDGYHLLDSLVVLCRGR